MKKKPEWGDDSVYPPKIDAFENWCKKCRHIEESCKCEEPDIYLAHIVYKRVPKYTRCECSKCKDKRKSKGKRKSDRKRFLVNTI